ncbi:MAG: ATP-binding domain-containing protein [Clostridia bacterium]|nr:ATP-binding domain-containing protein [Clostridia bacterium]
MYEYQIIPAMIRSAKQYYEYLCRTDKGNEKIPLLKIVRINDFELKLHLAKKLYTPDDFCINVNNRIYPMEELKVTNYDYDLKILTIMPEQSIGNDITDTDIDKIHIISDLKFLVKRVIAWYEWCEKNNYPIKLKRAISWHKTPSLISQSQIDQCQKEAVKSTLTATLSYIWGAPGTGKTRYVLANSVLSNFKAHKRVLVVAPTNNSLEQSLYGIIEVLDSKGISRNEILRLGTPSKKFASDYPECCEIEGVMKNIYELMETVKSLKEQKKKILFYERYQTLANLIIPTVRELSTLINYFHNIENQISTKQDKIKHIDILLSKEYQQETEFSKNIEALEKKAKSFSAKLFKNKKRNIEAKLSEFYLQLKSCVETQQKFTQYKTTLLNEISELKLQLDYNKVNETILDIKQFSSISQQFSETVHNLSVDNCDDVLEVLQTLEQQGKDKLDEIELDDFESSSDDIQYQIDKYILEIEILQAKRTGERLKNVKVIATTIDGFTANIDLVSFAQTGSEYKIHQVYLDEAGYCSLIKGLTLFACDVPITFLGDHMQLPPVCEMNDDELEKDDNFPVFLWAQSALAVEDIFNYSLEDSFLRYKEAEDFEFQHLSKSDLTVTYRFGAALSEILDSYVYKNGFKSANSVNDLTIKVVDAPKSLGNQKRENPSEVNAIKQLLDQYEDKDYAILTPYRNQLKLLNQNLPKARREQRIMTVHASQGREFDTVILSVVDTHNMYFTDTTNKLSRGLQIINTAVSRAKKELIIVCDTGFWSEQNHQLIAEIINVANK